MRTDSPLLHFYYSKLPKAQGGTLNCPVGSYKDANGICVPIMSRNQQQVVSDETRVARRDYEGERASNFRKAVASQPQLKQGRPETEYEAQVRKYKNKGAVAKNPNAVVNEQGYIVPKYADTDEYGRVINRQANIQRRMQGAAAGIASPFVAAAGVLGAGAAGAATIPYIAPALNAPLLGTFGSQYGTAAITGQNLLGLGFGLKGASNLGGDIDSGYYNSSAPLSEKIDRGLLTAMDIGFSPGVTKPLGMGYSAAKNALIKSTQEGLLSNTYKINPWAFKPNPEAAYRGIGKAGYDDLIQTGEVRSLKTNAYPEPYFVKGREPGNYAKGYMIELNPNEPMKGVGAFKDYYNDLIGTPVNKININNPNLKVYKEDWLKGYKQIKLPKPKFISSQPEITRGPINYFDEPGFAARNPKFKPEAYGNTVNKFGKTSGDISPEQMPYLSNAGDIDKTEYNKYLEYLRQEKLKQQSGDILRREGLPNPMDGGSYKAPSNEITFRDPNTGEVVFNYEAADYGNFKTPELYNQAKKDLSLSKRDYWKKIIGTRDANVNMAKTLGMYRPIESPNVLKFENLLNNKKFPGFDIPDYIENLGADMPMYYRNIKGGAENVSGIDFPEQMIPYTGRKAYNSITGNKYGGVTKAKEGGLLNRTITCPNCGHSWKSVDAGVDLLTCHKCGGMAKLQNGGTLPKAQTGISFFPQQDPEMIYRNKFNTELNKEEQKEFNKWVTKESKRQGRDILMDRGAYDVQGFWKSGDYKNMDEDNHGSDKWKKPNHPTFSNQSKYHGVDGFYGGNWTKEAGYQPSKQTADMYSPDYYKSMFGREPNRPERLDMSRFTSGVNRPSPLYYAKGGSYLPQAEVGVEMACPVGYYRDSKGKCVPYPFMSSNPQQTQAVDNVQVVNPAMSKEAILAQEVSNTNNFNKKWQNSPMYKEMITSSVAANPDKDKGIQELRTVVSDPSRIRVSEKDMRDPTLYGTTILLPFTKSGPTAQVTINNNSDGKDSRSSAIDHEILGHATDYGGALIPMADIEKMNKNFKSVKETNSFTTDPIRMYAEVNNMSYDQAKKEINEGLKNDPEFAKRWKQQVKDLKDFSNDIIKQDNYIKKPTETRARMMSVRKLAKEQKVYDPFTQKMTIENLRKLKKLNNSELNSLFDNYSEADLLDMFNTISMNDQSASQNMAKYGGLTRMQKGGIFLPKAELGTLTACPEGQVADASGKCKPKRLVNLRDATMTPEDLEYLNSSKSGYCIGGNCLEGSRKAYDLTAGRLKGIPNSTDIWANDLRLESTAGTPTPEQVAKFPYYAGDRAFGSADSWDVQGSIVQAGGKNIYSQGLNQTVPTDVPLGAVYGWGPSGTKKSSFKNRTAGLNTKYNLQPSHHSTISVGFNEQGEEILYDAYLRKYGTVKEIGDILKKELGYELENISVPKSVAQNTRASLKERNLLLNELTAYTPNVNALLSASSQDWAKINEDGKLRKPNVDKEKLNSFAKSLSDNKGELISSLGLSNDEYDRLANQALAIAMAESEGGGSLGFTDRFGSTQGMTQLNVENITKDDRLKNALNKKYKGVNPKDIRDPKASAVATMMYLSVANKDAQRLFEQGKNSSTRTFEKPGLISYFRSSNSRLNNDGVFVDELNKRIPFSEIPGYNAKDVNKINDYFKRITKSNNYSFVKEGNDVVLKLKTKGNNPKLTDIEKMAYMWQSPNSLKTGDAQGNSQYVSRIKNYYEALQNKKKDGGSYNNAEANPLLNYYLQKTSKKK
jgi:hypothetical protein